jgi:hypothetical protein
MPHLQLSPGYQVRCVLLDGRPEADAATDTGRMSQAEGTPTSPCSLECKAGRLSSDDGMQGRMMWGWTRCLALNRQVHGKVPCC